MLSWDDFRYVKAIADTRSLSARGRSARVNHSRLFGGSARSSSSSAPGCSSAAAPATRSPPAASKWWSSAERMGDDIAGFERRVTGQDLRPSGNSGSPPATSSCCTCSVNVLIGFRRAYPEIMLYSWPSTNASNCRSATPTWRCAPPTMTRTRWPEQGRAHRVGGLRLGRARGRAVRSRDRPPSARLGRVCRCHLDRKGDEVAQGPRRREAHRLQAQQHGRLGGSGRRRRGDRPAALLCRHRRARAGAAQRAFAELKASFGCSPIRTSQHRARARLPRLLRRRDRPPAQDHRGPELKGRANARAHDVARLAYWGNANGRPVDHRLPGPPVRDRRCGSLRAREAVRRRLRRGPSRRVDRLPG